MYKKPTKKLEVEYPVSRKKIGLPMDPLEIDSTPKRNRKRAMRTTIIGIIILIVAVLAGMRLHKVFVCAEAHGFYQRSHCNGNQCCHEVPYSFK